MLNSDGEELDSDEFVVFDDEPDVEANLESEAIYKAVEDRLLARNGIDRSQVEIEEPRNMFP